jgi:adenylate cyclase
MTEERARRRLAAILAADVVGFSRLMAVDEPGTLAALKARRREVLMPLVGKHQGRVFKVAGDGVLVEFASAVNAVECAVELQQAMASANRDIPAERHIILRVGINLGDVMVEGSDLYGDGVNVAARLESIAKPGFIVISATAFEYIKGKVRVGFEDLGPQPLKNIDEPVRAYQVTPLDMAANRPATPGKPSIAVLAFENMSGDPEQEYFGDGIAEDIITDLSKISGLAVAARNTSFALKGKAMDIVQMARQLGVTHVVEGSVRKAGNRIRISAQLVDGRVGHHLWAERYDRELSDIFALQDEISHAIVDALKVRLAPHEQADLGRRTTDNVDAYQLYMMGRFYLRSKGRHSRQMAADLFRRATELDPKFARAWANLALAHSLLRTRGKTDVSFKDIEGFIATALQLDENLAEAHAARAELLLRHLDITAAEAVARRAIELDPTLHDAHYALAESLRRSRRFEEAARAFDAAIPLDDQDWVSAVQGSWCYEEIGDLDSARRLGLEGLRRLERAMRFDPENAKAYSVGSFLLRFLGQHDRAVEWAKRSMEIDPDDHLVQYNGACFFLKMGQTDYAFDLLDRCMPQLGRAQLDWMLLDPDFDAVRDHPRYLDLVQREEERWSRTSS